jgi:hypothetical protein
VEHVGRALPSGGGPPSDRPGRSTVRVQRPCESVDRVPVRIRHSARRARARRLVRRGRPAARGIDHPGALRIAGSADPRRLDPARGACRVGTSILVAAGVRVLGSRHARERAPGGPRFRVALYGSAGRRRRSFRDRGGAGDGRDAGRCAPVRGLLGDGARAGDRRLLRAPRDAVGGQVGAAPLRGGRAGGAVRGAPRHRGGPCGGGRSPRGGRRRREPGGSQSRGERRRPGSRRRSGRGRVEHRLGPGQPASVHRRDPVLGPGEVRRVVRLALRRVLRGAAGRTRRQPGDRSRERPGRGPRGHRSGQPARPVERAYPLGRSLTAPGRGPRGVDGLTPVR